MPAPRRTLHQFLTLPLHAGFISVRLSLSHSQAAAAERRTQKWHSTVGQTTIARPQFLGAIPYLDSFNSAESSV